MNIVESKYKYNEVEPKQKGMYDVYSCRNCSYAIEVYSLDERLLPPCPCCECMIYDKCTSEAH